MYKRQVLEKAAVLLEEIEHLQLFATLEKGVFADIKRRRDGGKGLEGVCLKSAAYFNPFIDIFLHREGGERA